MGEQAKRFSIVVGIDFSEMSTEALRVAMNLAHGAGDSIVHLVHVLSPQAAATTLPLMSTFEAAEAGARKEMTALHASVMATSRVPVTAQVIVGTPTEVLPTFAGDSRADLIVVGTHGRQGIAHFVFGSVAEAVTRRAPCSVLTVRPRVLAPEERIEPPCAACAEQVQATSDKGATCPRHMPRQHPRAHTYSELPNGFGLGSQSFQFPER